MRMFIPLVLTMLVTPLFADDYEDNLKRWESFVMSNSWGSSSDFWLEKKTSYGWEKVILVFGYADDYDACDDLKTALEAKYSAALYRCMPANKK